MSKRRRPLLAEAAEIRALFENARALLESVEELGLDQDPDDKERIIESNTRHAAGIEALRFCCVAAGLARDPSLVPIVAESLEIIDDWRDRTDSHLRVMAAGLTDLLDAGAPADAEVEGLARHRDEEVRAAVASGLKPRGERALALLDALAADPSPGVRGAARASLEEVQEVPWWQGKFRSDPAARLDPEDAARLKPAFERLSELLAQRRWRSSAGARAEIAAHAAALPDALAVEVVEIVHSGADRHGNQEPELMTLMLSREGGLDAFARLCARWVEEGRHSMGAALAGAIIALPEPRRADVCLALARRAAALPEPARNSGAGPLMAEVACLGWPPGRDLTPVLDVALSIPPPARPHATDGVAFHLGKALAAEGADPAPILERVIEARLSGYPGAWASIRWAADRLLERASGPALRLAAEQAALSDDEDLAAWGIAILLGAAHDPLRDGPLSEVPARLLADPRARRVVLGNRGLSQRAVAPLREALREGQLPYPEACAALRVVGSFWGGVVDTDHLSSGIEDHSPEHPRRVETREALAPFLGPPALRGPPTPEEWAALRAARATAISRPGPGGSFEDDRKGAPPLGLAVLPAGPWAPEDRGVLEAALARMRAGDADAAVPIGQMLLGKVEARDAPLFDELCARVNDETRPMLRRMRSCALKALGLPLRPAGDGDGDGDEGEGEGEDDGKGHAREWMDEED